MAATANLIEGSTAEDPHPVLQRPPVELAFSGLPSGAERGGGEGSASRVAMTRVKVPIAPRPWAARRLGRSAHAG